MPSNKRGLQKNRLIEWSPEHARAFEDLRQMLQTALILAYHGFSKQFILSTDASQIGTGATLSQMQDDRRRTIAYDSQKLIGPEKHWSTPEKGLYALVQGYKTFQAYLYGANFNLHTDAKRSIWIRTTALTPRFTRWSSLLLALYFKSNTFPESKT